MPGRSVLARDGLSFLALGATSIVLFVVTLFFFQSLERHREVLGRKLANQGRVELAADQPGQAIVALRQALTFREDFPTQVLLAEALASAGRTQEAISYVQDLREAQPGDGMLNLQLAHLYSEQGDVPDAITSFRSAIVGDWKGDGALRRREVRLELAQYLTEHGQASAGREEVLTAAGNAPETLAYDLLFGAQLQRLGDTEGASQMYKKALKLAPRDYNALAGAGKSAYALGDYDDAARLLTDAVEESNGSRSLHNLQTGNNPVLGEALGDATLQRSEIESLASNARRLRALEMSSSLPAPERTEHLLAASRIAEARLHACMVEQNVVFVPNDTSSPAKALAENSPLQTLAALWHAIGPRMKQRTLEQDAVLGDRVQGLVDATETTTAKACGTPQGDDALLLLLAGSNNHP